MTATDSTKRGTKVFHPTTGVIVKITGRNSTFVGRNGRYTMLRISGGAYYPAQSLNLV